MAREHYPEIRHYDLIAQTEQYNLSNAAKAWIPQVVFSGQATYQSATATYPDALSDMLRANGINNVGLRKDQYKLALDVTQTIWDGGLNKAQRSIIEAEAEEQRKSVDVNLYALQKRVDDLYFSILLLDAQIVQTDAQIELLASNLEKVRSYYKHGVAMQADVSALEAEVLAARQALEQMKTSRASFRRMLEIFIGRPLTDEKLQRPVAERVTSRISQRPELALFDASIEKLSAQHRSVESSVMPKFSAFAQGFYGYPGLDMFKSMTSTDWTLNALIGVRMSWNLSAFYTRKNTLSNLRSAEERISVQRDAFCFNTQLQTAQDDGEIARLRKAVEDDGRIVELRRQVRMAAESQLKNGVIDVSDLLDKITDETTAAQKRNSHEIELLQAIYRLKHTLNQ